MIPELIKFGPFVLRSYGLMVAVGFGIGAWWLVRRGRAKGLPVTHLLDLAIAMILTGLAGARLLYVATHWQEFSGQLWRIVWPIQSCGVVGMHGMVFYGGLIAAVPTAVMLMKRWKLEPFKVLDAAAPPLALGTAAGRTGCFLNGCCYGIPTDGPLGVVFPVESMAGSTFTGISIHPVQLYMVFNNLLIVAILLLIERRLAKFDGIVIGIYFVLVGLMRGYEDLLRYYEGGMGLFNHMLNWAFAVVGVLLIVWSRSRRADSLD